MSNSPHIRCCPPGHRTITPHLWVRNANRALTFMQKGFDAKTVHQLTRPDGAILYLEVKIGGSMLLVRRAADDALSMPAMLYLDAADTDAAYQRGIAAGATSILEPTALYDGYRHAGLRDGEGNLWWIATRLEQLDKATAAYFHSPALFKEAAMPLSSVRPGFHTITPYLVVSDVARLARFLQATFAAEEARRIAKPDGTPTYLEMKIGDSMLMIAEAAADWPPMPATVYLYVEDTDAAFQRAIAAGATGLMPPTDMYYGDRNAGVRDSSGNLWWIATHFEDVSQAELQRRELTQM